MPTAAAAGCVVSARTDPGFAGIGVLRTATFSCNAGVATLTGAQGASFPVTGCFDVSATVYDATAGGMATIVEAQCAGKEVPAGGSVNCGGAVNPICAAGYEPSQSGGCYPCPSGLAPAGVGGNCTGPPSPSGVCPPGSTPVSNPAFPAGPPAFCTSSFLTSEVRPVNTVNVTIQPSAPHVYSVEFTGYVPTDGQGVCPVGTVQSAALTFRRPGNASFTGAACEFDLRLNLAAVEATVLTVGPSGSCGGSIPFTAAGLFVGTPCLVSVSATGIVVLKTGVNCADGSEPINGTSAVSSGFPDGSRFSCIGDALDVINIPVPNLSIRLDAHGAIFNPQCVPASFADTPTPTVLPVTPTRTPLATPLVQRTATATPGVPPTPESQPSGSRPALCGPPGTSSLDVTTTNTGAIGVIGNQVGFSAQANPPNPAMNSVVDVVGGFTLDNLGRGGVPMYALFQYPSGGYQCGPVQTDSTGVASCRSTVGSTPDGTLVPVKVDFILNCTDFTTSTSFVVGATATPVTTPAPSATATPSAPAPNGVCLLRQGTGDVTISASVASKINNQPVLSTTAVVGTFDIASPTPAPVTASVVPTRIPLSTVTNTPVPTAASTAIPVPTNTPVPATPTSTATTVPTPKPTFTPTPTSTSVPTALPLTYALDAARVARPGNPGNKRGLDEVHPGDTVWLMQYFTVRSIPHRVNRTTTYEVRLNGRSRFKASYPDRQTLTGTFARFIPYVFPSDSPYGVYEFAASLRLDGGKTLTERWVFSVVRNATLAPH